MLEISRERLKTMYCTERLTLHQIAIALGVSYGYIHKKMAEYNIVRRTSAQSRFKHLIGDYDAKVAEMYLGGASAGKITAQLGLSPAMVYTILTKLDIDRRIFTSKIADNPIYLLSTHRLRDLYDNQKMSARQIGSGFGISKTATENLLRKRGIVLRSYVESSSAMNIHRVPPLNDRQLQLIYGSLLGDACLHRSNFESNKTGRPLTSYLVQFAHGYKQRSYLDHKYSILPGTKITPYKPGFGKLGYRYCFCHTPTLTPIADICHDTDHHKKVSRKWLDKLTWEGIAYWYQDDGMLIIQRKRPTIQFCTHNFKPDELLLLQDLLNGFGLETRQASPGKGYKPWARLLVSRHKNQAIAFLQNIEPWIISHFRYKIRYLDRL